MNFYQSTLNFLRGATADEKDSLAIAEAEMFARFTQTAFYPEFIEELETKAATTGLDEKGFEGLLIAQGYRKALLEIVSSLRRRERVAKERLEPSNDEPADE